MKSKYLIEKGFTSVFLLFDNDLAGQTLLKKTSDLFLSLGVDVNAFSWTKCSKLFPTFDLDGMDLTDLFVKLQGNVSKLQETYEKCFILRKTEVEVQKENILPLEVIRGSGPGSLHYEISTFLRNYTPVKRGVGRLLLLSIAPGAGKTHAMLQVAETKAKYLFEQRKKEKERLLATIDEIRFELANCMPDVRDEVELFLQKMLKLYGQFSHINVVWYAPYKEGFNELMAMGANSDLWFDFKARNETNCQQWELVNELGENYHNIGAYCEMGCPHKENCMYQAQKEEMLEKPIVFFRHQHLLASLPSGVETIFIDEAAYQIFETPLVIEPNELTPFSEDWESSVLDDTGLTEILKFFVKAIRMVAGFNRNEPITSEDYVINGKKLIKMFQGTYEQHNKKLTELLLISKEVMEDYQPTFRGGENDHIKKRCVAGLHSAICRELPSYIEDPTSHPPSSLNLVSGKYEIYQEARLKIPARIPIVIGDATALPEYYEAMYKREIKISNQKFNNPHAQVVVLTGSDWTKGYLDSALGTRYADRVHTVSAKIKDTDGNVVDLTSIPQFRDAYNSKVATDALVLLEYLVDRHPSLLVVTYKKFKEFLKSLTESLHAEWYKDQTLPGQKQVVWGHYGALRGSNAYNNFEAVALIGVFRIPYDVLWRRVQMWGHNLNLEDTIPFELVKKERSYGDINGLKGEYLTFSHWLGEKVVDSVEVGEMIQCSQRIRPHSSEKKKVIYIFATRPVADLATKVLSKSNLVKEITARKVRTVADFLESSYQKDRKFPSYRFTANKYNISNREIKRLRIEIQERINAHDEQPQGSS
jgi:hypothetical protein